MPGVYDFHKQFFRNGLGKFSIVLLLLFLLYHNVCRLSKAVGLKKPFYFFFGKGIFGLLGYKESQSLLKIWLLEINIKTE